MFQTAVDRIRQLFPARAHFCGHRQEQAQELQAQCSEIPIENYLIEPAAGARPRLSAWLASPCSRLTRKQLWPFLARIIS